ncbi:MAG: 4-(cytidine 5'-diphospho)-2-C-methyl-D-erythritol kinase [Clostridia bacterium]|nr:4-(cytidine 5'-diphospho)-2-C-methyl-D-erythritol kinase [Clostridia bacterium]
MELTLPAYAKINLYLDITGKLENGYHEILSLMQSVSLCDFITLTLAPEENGEITLECDAPNVPTGEKNLAYRAAKRYFETIGRFPKTHIRIEKHIPMEAGLAGGSTDAAATLVGLNRLLGGPLSLSELCSIGKSLGADVPFCICGGTMEAKGIGEILTKKPPMPKLPIVIAKKGAGVSTPGAYRALDELYHDFANCDGTASEGCYDALLSAIERGDTDGIAKGTYNIFEETVFPYHDEARFLQAFFMENGAIASRMSGSGPSVFGIFQAEEAAIRAADRINRGAGEQIAFVTFPVSDSEEL